MKLCVAGLGGLGSAIISSLIENKEIFINTIYLLDMDTVERCNTGNQIYEEKNIGEYKVTATKNRIKREGFHGDIFPIVIDINMPENIPEDILGCDIYIAALDTYESRVNFYYHIVQEAKVSDRLYIDTGTERFKGHCFFTKGNLLNPCIYCIKWLFPSPKKILPVCTVRSSLPEKSTPESKTSILLSILSGINDSRISPKKDHLTLQNHKVTTNLHEIPSMLNFSECKYASTARIYNKAYAASKEEEVSPEYVRKIEGDLEIEPNTPITSFILANIVCQVIHKMPQGNFILYSGDCTPVLHLHQLSPDPECFLCF
ncbi:hypothetical protein NEAUS03_1570 [Nematocida ausubeli]|nr:hypothetical protein NEAUS03_1570 [Nematocida ausubeli]